MKSLLLLAAAVATLVSVDAAAQSGSQSAQNRQMTGRSSSGVQSASPHSTSTSRRQHQGTGTPQTTMAKRNSGQTVSTHPATGPTRASRSSSTRQSVNQGSATGSGNLETMGKNSQGNAPRPNSGASRAQ